MALAKVEDNKNDLYLAQKHLDLRQCSAAHRTRNAVNEARRTRLKPHESAVKSTKLIDILLLITVCCTFEACRAFYDWMMGFWAFATLFVRDVNLDRFQRWLWGTPQEQQQVLQENPAFSEEVKALFVLFQQHMGTQYEVNALRRQTLTLPALPDEGY